MYRSAAKERTTGVEATLQADGWTGINNHHLVAFMMNAKREIHTVRVLDTSTERKTAPVFLKHIEETLQSLGEDWKVVVVAFTSDASGESRAARIALLKKYPWLIVLDCYAHQVNLVVGDYLKCGGPTLAITDDAEELISWLRRRTFVLARIREVQTSNGKSAYAVIRPVATRWTSHYLAFKRLLELKPALAVILAEDQAAGGDSTFMAGIKTAAAKAKARQMLALIEDGHFWHSLNRIDISVAPRIKLHLEPLAIAAHVAQASHCRLDQVLLLFGTMYYRFSHLPPDIADPVASAAVLKSLEDRWAKADQAIFVAAVILNPLYRLQPFAELSEFVDMELEHLMVQLWKRLFRAEEAPQDLYDDFSDYLHKQGRFKRLEDHLKSKLERAQAQNIPIDPLDIWKAAGVSGRPEPPLTMLAKRILSVCANSASCERLFSIFGQLLTKQRNRMGSATLTALAELKMHLRDEYSRSQGMKERLKRHCGKPQETPAPAAAINSQQVAASHPAGNNAASTRPADADEDESMDGGARTHTGGELRAISDALMRAAEDDSDPNPLLPSHYASAYGPDSQPFSRTLKELFDFGAPQWVARIEGFASRGLDEELEMYELLDFDGAGDSEPNIAGDSADFAEGSGDFELDAMTAEILQS
ncbi:hypothetical protein BN946_scf185000.g21 [Trametes cinnabarina]|uniref:DUF659 domain-containing protein n=1 Tax=Pycnoporus cinnabarinus TaxID=5643 RepID=A0A060S925_PYCCI|nr:hypothetical protein BN946_scf185000.g21 [Trametes cinnabarina]